MLSVTIPKDHISVPVIPDIPEMDTAVEVNDSFCLIGPKSVTT